MVINKPIVIIESLWGIILGLLSQSIFNPISPPFLQIGGWQPSVKTCIWNCSQVVPYMRYRLKVVYIAL